MNIVQYLSKLVGIVDGVAFVERRAKPQPALASQQGAVAHEFARDIETAIKFAVIQDGSQVGVIERTGSLQFPEELAARRIGQHRLRLNQLECHLAHEHGIFGFITFAGYSTAEPAYDAVSFKYMSRF